MTPDEKKNQRMAFPEIEERILKFWEKEKIFEQSLAQTKAGKPFVFFEGPPTANGRPGIHHVLARAYKDVVLRYKTMQGFFVERKAGWDTHGLPVELQVEKQLGISGKPDIEKFGIAEFNQKCKESVWQYKEEWERLTKRMGFWLDLEHPYVTYEPAYVESLWWVIKQIWDKDLLYRGHKVVPHCPRCGTALSSHEVAQGYKDVTDTSVFVKFKVVDQDDTYIVSWTTTPWTLPGNVALAVGKDIDYVKVKIDGSFYYCAAGVVDRLGSTYKVVEELKGAALVGLHYEPLFAINELQSPTSYQVYAADFVNTEEGTGVVHTAVMYGEDDYRLGESIGLPKFHTVDEQGKFTTAVPEFAGKFVKSATTERAIIASLSERELLLREEPYKHSYPFCWRCDTPLLYYAKDSWFIAMTKLKEQLIANNKTINWVPSHLQQGRFGEWLNEVKDWAFSRERYWGTPLPIWRSADDQYLCIGSFAELKQYAQKQELVGEAFDPHRPFVDDIVLVKDGREYHRVPEVIDVWFDSGAMPFAQWHYPFENAERIDTGVSFPADYISEAVDQTRGWFYTLLAVSTLIGKSAPYQNVVCLGHILDDKGQKMSKSKGNVVDPFVMMDTYGVDAVRWFLFTVNQPGEAKLFVEQQVHEVVKKNWMILSNVVSFWKLYAGEVRSEPERPQVSHVLDQWALARLDSVVAFVTQKFDVYAITEATRAITDYIQDLSTWYVRRSRGRMKQASVDKDQALQTLQYSLVTLSKVLAPAAPFFAEWMYQETTGAKQKSVHLATWPAAHAVDAELLKKMQQVRAVVELGHSLRKTKEIKVRQPLSQLVIPELALDADLLTIIQEELNVVSVVPAKKMPTGVEFVASSEGSMQVALDITITDELKQQGIVREIVRHLNALRKDAGLTITDHITVYYEIGSEELEGIVKHFRDVICREVVADHCLKDIPENVDLKKVLDLGGTKLLFGIKKL
ncbi:MAG: isoleucine--tRNA ligase [Candidatus Kerfeldbacteria bacterium]|nr:isoleucine--tRNA ligase [Candidatus Kerfeldbacteria bacterium]